MKKWLGKVVPESTKAKAVVILLAVFMSVAALGSATRPDVQTTELQNSETVHSAQADAVTLSEKPKIAVTKTEIVTNEEEVPFATTETYDGTLPKETTVVRVEGKVGKKVIKTEIKTKDGVEVGRALISEEITVPPVAKVVAIGTKVVSNKPQSQGSGNCDKHYIPCVKPTSRDLDCSDVGHRVMVITIGEDPHGFDRDEDGIGCETYPEM